MIAISYGSGRLFLYSGGYHCSGYARLVILLTTIIVFNA